MFTNPLIWLLDVETYNFHTGGLRDADVFGKVMIISTQIWSLIRGDTVFSMLIGPGVFKGYAEKNNIHVDLIEHLAGIMFDPSHLRISEPLPCIDVVNPEVIDPLAARKSEEIVTILRKVIVERGNVLPGNLILRHTPKASVPITAHTLELAKRINVSYVSGVQRAKFILAGTNGPLYRKFLDCYQRRGYINPERLKILAEPFDRFARFDDQEVMNDWIIVEKSAFDQTIGGKAIAKEYDAVFAAVEKHKPAYIFGD